MDRADFYGLGLNFPSLLPSLPLSLFLSPLPSSLPFSNIFSFVLVPFIYLFFVLVKVFLLHIQHPKWYVCRNLMSKDHKGHRGWPRASGMSAGRMGSLRAWMHECMWKEELSIWTLGLACVSATCWKFHILALLAGYKIVFDGFKHMSFMSPYSCP